MARIEVAIPELPGVSIEQGLIRSYPLGESAAHVIGYVAPVSEEELSGDPLLELPDFRIGKSGIEKSQDAELRGKAGTSQVEVNAFGRVVRELARVRRQPGQDVVSCLDAGDAGLSSPSAAAPRRASPACCSTSVTGDVLALVSSPSFDPAPFATGLYSSDLAAALVGSAQPADQQGDRGRLPAGLDLQAGGRAGGAEGRSIDARYVDHLPGLSPARRCHVSLLAEERARHVSVCDDAIKKSCDVFFYETARRVGIDHIAAMAHRFGFGGVLGLDIPGERAGLIPSREWKLATIGIAWQPGETLIAGIGQGSVLATPLQLATMVARLVTGRAVVPRLVRTQGYCCPAATTGSYPTSPNWASAAHVLVLMLDGMNAVVNEQGGTAYAARIKDPGLAMGGKSGTSQVRAHHRIRARARPAQEQ